MSAWKEALYQSVSDIESFAPACTIADTNLAADVAESVARKYRGNLVSLYQFNIALGEVFGYVVAAIFVNVKSGSWRYMLGSSLVFSTIMLVGMFFMPESPRFLMHKGKYLESFDVWKRIRGTELPENREEFFVMKHSLEEETANPSRRTKMVWLDFITVPRARRSIVYATIMIFLGQFTGTCYSQLKR